jgi:hypothetical protein
MAAHGKLQVATRVFDGSINSPREGRLHNKSTGLVAGQQVARGLYILSRRV